MSQEFTTELKTLLIEGLHLDDVKPEDIDNEAPLFGEGLGLDSIDALEISVLLDRNYGVRITSGDERNQEIFSSMQALSEFVTASRTK